MWDVEEEAVEGVLPRVDDPLRSGAAQGGGGGGGQGGGYREGPEESTYDFDRDYVSSSALLFFLSSDW